MVHKNFFVLGIFLIFLLSNVFSVTITESESVTPVIDYTQSFAQINAKITDLANQINAMKVQDLNAQLNSVQKSDLPIIYENISKSVQAVEQQIVLDNIIIVILAFSVMFLLIGKNMIPQNKKPVKEEIEAPLDIVQEVATIHKKEPKTKKESKKGFKDEEMILVPEEIGGI